MNRTFIPPLSDKFSVGIATKNHWLLNYVTFCNSHSHLPTFIQDRKNFQAAIGKNTSFLVDRFRGALIGLAIGDALGTTLEFTNRTEYENHTDIIGGGPFGLKPGQWTDDTSMALCIAYSLLEKRMFDEHHQMQLYTQWWRDGLFSSTGSCFDIGNTIAGALSRFEKNGNAFAGSTDDRSAGNGSLMRLAPVVLFYASHYYLMSPEFYSLYPWNMHPESSFVLSLIVSPA